MNQADKSNPDAAGETRTSRPSSLSELGRRLSAVMDRIGTRSKASVVAERSADQLWKYARGSVEPPFLPLARLCLAAGARMEWLATGEGEMLAGLMPPETAPQSQSHALRRDVLKVAVQLAEEALDGRALVPADYAELVDLIYDALANGLPSAQVLAFARPAARGIGLRGDEDANPVDRPGAPVAGAGK